MSGDMQGGSVEGNLKMRSLHKKTRQMRKVRVLPQVEINATRLELPRRKMVKKKRILSGMMVGPIDPKCWETPPAPQAMR